RCLDGFRGWRKARLIEVRQTGPVPEELPVWQKITSSVVPPGGSHHNDEKVSEVTDLVKDTLPDKLFQPPDGYQRVASLPDTASRPVSRTGLPSKCLGGGARILSRR